MTSLSLSSTGQQPTACRDTGNTTLWWITALLAAFLAAPLVAQTAVDLPPPAANQIASANLDDDRSFEIEDLLWQADQLVGTDAAAAASLYSQAIDLAAPGGAVPTPGKSRQMLIQAYIGRAAAQLNTRQTTAAESDLTRILQIDPDIELTGGAATGDAVALFERIRKRSMAGLDLQINPTDTVVFIDGRRLSDPGRRHYLPPGNHELRVSRPGFAGEQRTISLTAGKRSTQRFELPRTSAAIRFGVRPAGAWLELDRRRLPVAGPNVRCLTIGAGDTRQMDCLIGGLTPGGHQIRVGGDGWRQRELNFEVEQLTDLRFPDIQLERTSAALILTGVPASAQVTLDDQDVAPETDSGGDLRLATTPGPHQIVINTGSRGLFQTMVNLSDQQELRVTVEPLPSLSLVGVFGPDQVAAADLAVELAGKAETVDGWTFLDNSRAGAEVARNAGIDPLQLRALAGPLMTATDPDWAQIQHHLDRDLPASLHLLAILDDQSYARYADLWLLAAAPGPARPVRLRIDLTGDTRAAALLSFLAPPLAFSKLGLGADFVDLPGITGATAIQVTPGGPAARAGLQVGQSVTRLGNQVVTDVATLHSILARTDDGARLPIELRSAGIEITVEIQPDRGPVILSPSASRQLYPALWARLEWAARRSPVDPWVLDLNRAALYLAAQAWSEAATLLQGLSMPKRAGVGTGTARYWLGRALEAGGGSVQQEQAAAAYTAAGEEPLARFEDDSGPPVAPRARIRLQGLLQPGR